MTAATDHGERPARLEGAYDHLATKDDVTKATLKILLWLVGAAAPIWIGLAIQLFLSLRG